MRKLTVDDIVDHRAYERERDEFRARIIEVKRRRRVQLGEIVTIVFENTDTMRFQVQEMARAERMLTDDAIAHEVATYNELIPGPGELSGTLFIELVDDARLRNWLPRLVGIEFAVRFELADGSRVESVPEDEERLTRDDITSTVHYLKFPFTPDQRAAFASRPGAARGRPSRVLGRGRAQRRAARRARARLHGVARVHIRVNASIPTCRCRISSTPTTRATTSTPARRSRSRREAVAASCPRASRWRSRRATQGSCSRGRVSR